MLHKRFFSLFCLTITLAFIMSILPMGGSVAAQTPTGTCPPFNPAMVEQPDWLKSLPLECREKYWSFLEPEEKSDVAGQTLSPGPDDYGYTSEMVSYNWISADTESGVAGNNNYASFNLGFNFPFYENTYSQVNISTNGRVSFGSPSSWIYIDPIPSTYEPNDFVAPFNDFLVVGPPYNSGAIYYSQGGSAPDRYFVVEWRDVTSYYWDTTPFTFEAILYENGNTIFQYQSLPSNYYYATVGIENSDGTDGLQYHDRSSTGLSPSTAVRFNRPITSTPRAKITPLKQGAFAATSGSTTFSFDVKNIGTNGNIYEFLGTPSWPLSLYASDGTTLLTDTDANTYIDTGPLAQGESRAILARFTPPGGASAGDYMNYDMTVRSSVDISKTSVVNFQLSIPTGFAGVYSDAGNNTFMIANPDGIGLFDIGGTGYDPAVARTSNGNYIYTWDQDGPSWGNIQYAVVGRDGSVIRSPADLIDNSGASLPIYDHQAAVAVSPVGFIGITWVREVYNPGTDQSNYNIYFEILDSSGTPAYGPVNVTNYATWWNWDSSGDHIEFYMPTIAATSDNNFVLGWTKESSGVNIVWYGVFDCTAAVVKPASAFTTTENSQVPAFNTLPNGNVILTWQREYSADTLYYVQNYAVLNSSGGVVKSATALSDYGNQPSNNSDAIALPNGNVAVGWISNVPGITFAILDSSYNLTAGPTDAISVQPYLVDNQALSMTTDYLSRVIFTWGNSNGNVLFYALGDSTATFLSPPLAYKTSVNNSEFNLSWGQGNAAVTTFSDVAPEYWSWSFVERLYNAGITGGCGSTPLIYCPEATVTRGQMAVFLERGMNGSSYSPPPATGTVFGDIPVSYWSASWVEKLYADEVTGGCGGGNYCPDLAVTRAQMAVFLLRAKHGSSYVPPAATGVFPDVPTSYWAAPWIEQLFAEGITGGCGGGNYCPDQAVTRGQMAVFLVRTFTLP